MVRSDEDTREELVGEEGSAVPIEPWYTEPGRVGVEEGLDENVRDLTAIPLLTMQSMTCFSSLSAFAAWIVRGLFFFPQQESVYPALSWIVSE